MAVKKAKYVYYTKGCEKAYSEGNFAFATLDQDEIEALQAQMQGWFVRDYSSWRIEYDDYDDVSYGSDSTLVAVPDIVSCTSGMYSSSDVRGDILIDRDNNFVGVILYIVEEGGNGWSNYNRSHYALLFTDGTTYGKAEKSYCFAGESSSKDYTNSYDLVKKEDN